MICKSVGHSVCIAGIKALCSHSEATTRRPRSGRSLPIAGHDFGSGGGADEGKENSPARALELPPQLQSESRS